MTAPTGPAGEDLALAALVLRAATQLVDAIQDGVVARGFDDVRPAHGFAFSRISAGGASVVDLADHLGVTKQAASQMVERLVRSGYVARVPDPVDGRVWRLRLTAKGAACTQAAEEAMADAVRAWERRVGARRRAELHRALAAIVDPGPLRPTW